MCNFNIGEKVVCIDPTRKLIKNEIYIVAEIIECDCGCSLIRISDYHDEFTHTLCICDKEYETNQWFQSKRFRKLDYKFADNIIAMVSKPKEIVTTIIIEEIW